MTTITLNFPEGRDDLKLLDSIMSDIKSAGTCTDDYVECGGWEAKKENDRWIIDMPYDSTPWVWPVEKYSAEDLANRFAYETAKIIINNDRQVEMIDALIMTLLRAKDQISENPQNRLPMTWEHNKPF